jgi:hypothetical protein
MSVRDAFFVQAEWFNTYQLIDIPAPMLATLLSLYHALMYTEMPIHVRCLLLLAFLVVLKAASALRAWNTKTLVKCSD